MWKGWYGTGWVYSIFSHAKGNATNTWGWYFFVVDKGLSSAGNVEFVNDTMLCFKDIYQNKLSACVKKVVTRGMSVTYYRLRQEWLVQLILSWSRWFVQRGEVPHQKIDKIWGVTELWSQISTFWGEQEQKMRFVYGNFTFLNMSKKSTYLQSVSIESHSTTSEGYILLTI
jgi:hypothetical protein